MSDDVVATGSAALPTEHVRAKTDDDTQPSGQKRLRRKASEGDTRENESRHKRRQVKVVGPKVERPRPRSGMPLILFGVQQVIRPIPLMWGVDYRFTNPNRTKRDALKQNYDALMELLVDLAEHHRRIITVMNSKGGAGKTPTSCYMGSIFQEVTNNQSMLLDLNQNVGTANDFLGISRFKTLRLIEAIETRATLMRLSVLSEKAKAHRQTGLRLIASEDADAEDVNAESVKYTRKEYESLVKNVDEAVHSIFVDTGNGMSHPSNLAAIETADAMVFSGLWDENSKLKGIAETLKGYIVRGFGEKIWKHAYIVINATPPNLSKEKAFETFSELVFDSMYSSSDAITDVEERKRRTKILMDHLGIKFERFFIVPYSRHIDKDKVVDVRPRVMGLATKVAYLELLVAIYGAKLEKDPEPVNTPDVFEQELAGLIERSAHPSNASPNTVPLEET